MQSRPAGREPAIRLRFPEPSPIAIFLQGAIVAALGVWMAASAVSSLRTAPPAPHPAPAPAAAPADRPDALAAFVGSATAPTVGHTITPQDLRHAAREAVDWLLRHQFPEGSWDPERYYVSCAGLPCDGRGRGDHETGVTALSVLALLRSGACDFAVPLDREGPATRGARRGLDWLVRAQDGDGAVGDPAGPKFLYGHAIAALTLAEGFLWSGDARYRSATRRAVRLLESARAPAGGWRYAAGDGDADTSVTGWAVAAFGAAVRIGIDPDPASAPAARRWIERVTDPIDFRVGYTRRGTAGSALAGVNDHFAANEACTAIGIAVRRAAGDGAAEPAVREGIRRLARDLPRWEPGRVDYYYWYHGTQALASTEGSEGPCRRAWREAAARALVPHQIWESAVPRKGSHGPGCARGSWDPADKWGSEGGRICATALNALTLQALLENE
jgi:hypothetical protein